MEQNTKPLEANSQWIARAQVEDLMSDLGFDAVCGVLPRLIGLPLQDRFRRPRSKTTCAIGIEHALSVDVVAMLIGLERLGLAIDPSPSSPVHAAGGLFPV